jgi:hypothetical protein
MAQLVPEIAAASKVYRRFVESAGNLDGRIDELGLFAYRSSVLESEVVKPIVVYLLDPALPAVPAEQITKGLAALESWLVRRMLIRASTKSYTQMVAEMVTQLLKSERAAAGDVIYAFLKDQGVESRYWPDDNEVRTELRQLLVYRKLRRPRIRMVLEAIEDHRRGWRMGREGLGGSRVLRGKYAIEHILPVKWHKTWPLDPGVAEAERDRLAHTMGNLTLLTGRLNSGVSNGPWTAKAEGLRQHDVLILNRDLLDAGRSGWSHDQIRRRTDEMIDDVLTIWPVPEGHTSAFARTVDRPRHKIEISDLLGAGLLSAGQELIPRQRKFVNRRATVLADGRLEVDGRSFHTPSGAASHIAGGNRNGWAYFYLDSEAKRRLNDLWYEYVDLTSADADESDVGDEDDDDDDGES